MCLFDLIGNNIFLYVWVFWRVVCFIYLFIWDIMKFIWIVFFLVFEIIKVYKIFLFLYCLIVNYYKLRCVWLKFWMFLGGEYGNRIILKILLWFDKWYCIERSYKKKIFLGIDCEDLIIGYLCLVWDGKF